MKDEEIGWWNTEVDKCKMLVRSKAYKANGLIMQQDGYARVGIGKDKDGMEVYESMHRLVCWSRYGIDVNKPHATHVGRQLDGDKGWGCRGKLCVNHNHLEWGGATSNRREYVDRTRRKKHKPM
jgi:hypothetical protein